MEENKMADLINLILLSQSEMNSHNMDLKVVRTQRRGPLLPRNRNVAFH